MPKHSAEDVNRANAADASPDGGPNGGPEAGDLTSDSPVDPDLPAEVETRVNAVLLEEGQPIIDLRDRDGKGTRLRLRDDNPFAELSHEERMRVIIRVLCELVAYDADLEEGQRTDRPAVND